MKKGMLIKMGEDLMRVLDVQHVTPGNLRGFVRAKMRNIRSGLLADNIRLILHCHLQCWLPRERHFRCFLHLRYCRHLD